MSIQKNLPLVKEQAVEEYVIEFSCMNYFLQKNKKSLAMAIILCYND